MTERNLLTSKILFLIGFGLLLRRMSETMCETIDMLPNVAVGTI